MLAIDQAAFSPCYCDDTSFQGLHEDDHVKGISRVYMRVIMSKGYLGFT
jgi:hypothetical protein